MFASIPGGRRDETRGLKERTIREGTCLAPSVVVDAAAHPARRTRSGRPPRPRPPTRDAGRCRDAQGRAREALRGAQQAQCRSPSDPRGPVPDDRHADVRASRHTRVQRPNPRRGSWTIALVRSRRSEGAPERGRVEVSTRLRPSSVSASCRRSRARLDDEPDREHERSHRAVSDLAETNRLGLELRRERPPRSSCFSLRHRTLLAHLRACWGSTEAGHDQSDMTPVAPPAHAEWSLPPRNGTEANHRGPGSDADVGLAQASPGRSKAPSKTSSTTRIVPVVSSTRPPAPTTRYLQEPSSSRAKCSSRARRCDTST